MLTQRELLGDTFIGPSVLLRAAQPDTFIGSSELLGDTFIGSSVRVDSQHQRAFFLTTTQLITLSRLARGPRGSAAIARYRGRLSGHRHRLSPHAESRSMHPFFFLSSSFPWFLFPCIFVPWTLFPFIIFQCILFPLICLRNRFHCSPASQAPPASSFQPGPCEPLDVAATAAF